METKTIKAVEFVRRIRDDHYEILESKTSEEIKEYFRKAADRARIPIEKEHVQ